MTAGSDAQQGRTARRRVSGWTLAASVYVFAVVMIGTTLPTPLYPLYQVEFGFGAAQTTLLFSIYAAAVIAALVLFGRLSEAIGRKPLLAAAILCSLASAVLFMIGSDLGLLYVGRVLSGIAAGIFTATGTVSVLENAAPQHRRMAAALATAANIGGLGIGNLMSGVVARFLPDPLFSPFLIHSVLVVIAGLALIVVREAPYRTSGSFRLQMPAVPVESRGVFLRAVPGAIACFAIAGLFSALAPNFMRQSLHMESSALVGLVVFLLFGASTLTQVVLQRLSDRTLILWGSVAMILSMGAVVAALVWGSFIVLVLSALLAGAGQGAHVTTGIRALMRVTPEPLRTSVTTSYFILAYLAMSVPIIGVGTLSLLIGLGPSTYAFAAVTAAVSMAALAGHGRWTSNH